MSAKSGRCGNSWPEKPRNAKLSLSAQLEALTSRSCSAPPQATAALIAQAEVAAAEIDIDEAATRTLIDAHLRARGWEVDTPTLRYSAGVRPAKGRNLAIAEWPTKSGPADYALFVGTRCIAVVEAKRQNKNVSASHRSGAAIRAWVSVRRRRRGYRGAVGRDRRKAASSCPSSFLRMAVRI